MARDDGARREGPNDRMDESKTRLARCRVAPARWRRLGGGRTMRSKHSRAAALRAGGCALAAALSLCLLGVGPAGQPGAGQALYEQRGCPACHTLGAGSLVGPDLRGVTERRDRDWLVR